MSKLASPVQKLALANALTVRGIHNKMDYSDGQKEVDIFVPEANLSIEIDGLPHYPDIRPILADLKRDHYADPDRILTVRFANKLIAKYLDEIANAIEEIANNEK